MPLLIADSFDFPLGTALERRQRTLPPGLWHIALGFLQYYSLGYHTGIDTLIEPGGGRGQPIHACANGEITYAARMRLPGYEVWGNLIIQRCYLPGWTAARPNDNLLYIRYAHSDPLYVKPGDRVVRGQVVSLLSDAFGVYYPHLHLDFSPTSILYRHPEHWPGQNYAAVLADYVDPMTYMRNHRPMGTELEQIDALADQTKVLQDQIKALVQIAKGNPGPVTPPPTSWVGQVATKELNVRDAPSTSGTTVATLKQGDAIEVGLVPVPANGHLWVKVINPLAWAGNWVAGDLLPIPNL